MSFYRLGLFRCNGFRINKVILPKHRNLSESCDSGSDKKDTSGFKQDTSGCKQNTSGFKQDNSEYKQDTSGCKQDTSEYKQDTSGCKKDTSEYKQDTSGCKQDTYEYNQDTSGCKQDTSEYKQDTSGCKKDTSEYKLDTSGCKQDTSEYKQDTSGCKQDTSEYKQDTSECKQDTSECKQDQDSSSTAIGQEPLNSGLNNPSAPTMYECRKYGHNLPLDSVMPNFETLPCIPTGIFRCTAGEVLGAGAKKGLAYQNPEYFSYHHMTFYDLHLVLGCYRHECPDTGRKK